MPDLHYDLIVIGAGALGSFHAYHACKKGLNVLLLEKDMQPSEATVRNFGQIVPSGMDQAKWQVYGRRSLEIYKEIQGRFDISVTQSGTVYLASDETELTLIHELAAINRSNSYESHLLSKEECLERYAGLKSSYCTGGLYFPEEITVDPAIMIHRLIHYMQEQLGLTYLPSTQVNACTSKNNACEAEDNFGNTYSGDNIIICNGRDFRTLYPELFYSSDIEVSKLQMMKTVSQGNFTLKGSILTGLSIRRYESFKECPSYESLNAGEIDPVCRKWGIHILFKQAADGSIIIGDSHEYADAAEQEKLGYELNYHINELILKEARQIFHLPGWEIASSWNGYYAQCKHQDLFQREVEPNIHIISAIGGKGMTASAGLAETTIQNIYK